MKIEFRRLSEVASAELIELMSHPRLRPHMPLIGESFGPQECERFVASKEKLWVKHGYGPWAFFVDDAFVGWGGLQPEQGDVDLALVLHPDAWGLGKAIYERILERAFGEMGFDSLIALLPPTRTRIQGLRRLGFRRDGEVTCNGERFYRYRLEAPTQA